METITAMGVSEGASLIPRSQHDAGEQFKRHTLISFGRCNESPIQDANIPLENRTLNDQGLREALLSKGLEEKEFVLL